MDITMELPSVLNRFKHIAMWLLVSLQYLLVLLGFLNVFRQ